MFVNSPTDIEMRTFFPYLVILDNVCVTHTVSSVSMPSDTGTSKLSVTIIRICDIMCQNSALKKVIELNHP